MIEPHTIKKIADQLVQTKVLMVPVASFETNVVNKRTDKIDLVQPKKNQEAVVPPNFSLRNRLMISRAPRESQDKTIDRKRTHVKGKRIAVEEKVRSRGRRENR